MKSVCTAATGREKDSALFSAPACTDAHVRACQRHALKMYHPMSRSVPFPLPFCSLPQRPSFAPAAQVTESTLRGDVLFRAGDVPVEYRGVAHARLYRAAEV